MTTMMETDMNVRTEDTAILDLLEKQHSASIEELMDRLAMSWERVFNGVDRLSRSGSVRLTRIAGEYYVEKTGGA